MIYPFSVIFHLIWIFVRPPFALTAILPRYRLYDHYNPAQFFFETASTTLARLIFVHVELQRTDTPTEIKPRAS